MMPVSMASPSGILTAFRISRRGGQCSVEWGTGKNFRFRGNALVEISPPVPTWPHNKGNWWLYQARAQKYQVSNAPMIEVKRFSTPLSFNW